MLKYAVSSVTVLLILSGCASKPEPKPEPVKVVLEKPKPKPKPVYVAPKRGKVPPLPKREKDIDVDSAVDNAMAGL